MKKTIFGLIALTLMLGFFNGAFAWTDYTSSDRLTFDGAPNGDGVYEFNTGLRVINEDSQNPIFFQIDPGVTLRFGDNDRGLRIEGNVILIAKGLPTRGEKSRTGYILFESVKDHQMKAPMINLVMAEDPKRNDADCFPKAVIEYCELEGPIETAIRSESADLIIRYNRIHTDCNGIFMADDRFEEDGDIALWVFSDRAEITGNIIEGYGGLFEYPEEFIKGSTLSVAEYAGSGIYFHAAVLNSITRNNILIQGINKKETGCGIFFRSLYQPSVDLRFRNIVNNNVIDHIPTDNTKLVDLNCGINIGINRYDSGTDPIEFDLEDMQLFINNNIIQETVAGIFIHNPDWYLNRPADLPSFIDYNDYYLVNEPWIIIDALGRPNRLEFGTNNLYEDPSFVSISDVNYRLSNNSLLYDEGTNGYAGVVNYTDIYVSSPSDLDYMVDIGAYSGGEECYRIQKHLTYPGLLYDNTRSWSGSVAKDHNEFIIFEDNMFVEEYADVSELETSFIEGLPPISWEFDNNYGINTHQTGILSVTHINPSGQPADSNRIFGSSWQGIASNGLGRISFDNFYLRGCDEAFTGAFHSLNLNDGLITDCNDYLLDTPTIVNLNLSNLVSAGSFDIIDNLINVGLVSGSIDIDNCDFFYREDGLIVGNTTSPVTLNNFNIFGTTGTSESIRIDEISSGGSLVVEDCELTAGRFGIRVVQSNGEIDISGNEVRSIDGATNDIPVFISNMTGTNLKINQNTIPYINKGIFLSSISSKIYIIGNQLLTLNSLSKGIEVYYASGPSLHIEDNHVNYGISGLSVGQSGTPIYINGDQYFAVNNSAEGIKIEDHTGALLVDTLSVNNGAYGINTTRVTGDITLKHATMTSNNESAITIDEHEGSFFVDTLNVSNSNYGIKLSDINGTIDVDKTVMSGISNDGINIQNCSGYEISIDNATIFFMGNGIYLNSLNDAVTITSSLLSGLNSDENSACVSMQGVTQAVNMSSLTCSNEGYGIFSTNNTGLTTVSNSRLYVPIPGSTIESHGIFSEDDSNSILIADCHFSEYKNGSSYGILIRSRDGYTEIRSDTLSNCYYGVYLPAAGQPIGGIELANNIYEWDGTPGTQSKAIHIFSGHPDETLTKTIQNETISGYKTGVRIQGLTSTLDISDCNLQDCIYGISLSDCNSGSDVISNCVIESDVNGEFGEGSGLTMIDVTGIQINTSSFETKSNCIVARDNVGFSIYGCDSITSTGIDTLNPEEGIGILSNVGFQMTHSCIRDCAKNAIKVIGTSNIINAPTVFLGSFDSVGSVELEGRNLIYNCGQEDSSPTIHPTNDHWMIDLVDDSQTLEKYATIQSTHNDLIIFQPNQVENIYYGPCFGKMIDHIDSSTVFIDTSWINNNYWGRYINDAAHDGQPFRTWFSWMLDDREEDLEWINICAPNRFTTFNTSPFADLPNPGNDAIGLPDNNISSHVSMEPNEIMANSSQTVISSTNATKVKNALMKISSMDGGSDYSTDQVISQLSQWADPDGTTMLELEAARLLSRKYIKQNMFDEASAVLDSWVENPMIMKRQADLEKLYLNYSRKLSDLKQEDPLKLNEWYAIELDKIYGVGSGNVDAEEDEIPNDVEEINLPMEFCIHQSYPNPFNPTATLKIDLPEVADVRIAIFNVMGQQVYNEVHEQMPAGYKTFNINGQEWSSGAYFISASAGNINKVQKIVLIK